MTGRKYGKWLALEYVGKRGTNYYWRCQCDCGNIRTVKSYNLRVGKSKNCPSCAKVRINRDQVKQLLAEGRKQSEIARLLKCSAATISEIARKLRGIIRIRRRVTLRINP